MVPMLDGALENLQRLGHSQEYLAGKICTADTSYHRDTNLRKCQELRLHADIPDIYCRQRPLLRLAAAVLGPGGSGLPWRIFTTRRPAITTSAPRERDSGDGQKSLRRWFGN